MWFNHRYKSKLLYLVYYYENYRGSLQTVHLAWLKVNYCFHIIMLIRVFHQWVVTLQVEEWVSSQLWGGPVHQSWVCVHGNGRPGRADNGDVHLLPSNTEADRLPAILLLWPRVVCTG